MSIFALKHGLVLVATQPTLHVCIPFPPVRIKVMLVACISTLAKRHSQSKDERVCKAQYLLCALVPTFIHCCDLFLCRWSNTQADLGHALVAFDIMANALSHPRVDVAHFWTTRWRYGGFAPTNNPGSVADALNVSLTSSPSTVL